MSSDMRWVWRTPATFATSCISSVLAETSSNTSIAIDGSCTRDRTSRASRVCLPMTFAIWRRSSAAERLRQLANVFQLLDRFDLAERLLNTVSAQQRRGTVGKAVMQL